MMAGFVNWFRCPSCQSGQLHDDPMGRSPIITCVSCHKRYCFHHQELWHETMTCDEYDQFLLDPDNFRSEFETENERAERVQEVEQRRRREMEASDRRYAESLVREENHRRDFQAWCARDDGVAWEEAERGHAKSKSATRDERERVEAERKAAQKKNQFAQDKAKAIEEVKRKKAEKLASEATIQKTTKRCPGFLCGRPIERNEGCAHMTGLLCGHEFCYECLADHQAILKSGNTKHKRGCMYHPDNLPGIDEEEWDDSYM
ncbi:hypothetical protein B0H63DRAFT_563986 [Podospora didyma]|uniref:RBR-type E3 ubiquitin transferase n=1 Tax=Podospora didyma TaxID=330526 RepID=A0AAE0K9Z1_9PEZI|nr:hypothetical protein B0H63DRAFT_563986 [Podospora didyma]